MLYPLSYGRSQERGFPHLADIIITSYIATCQVREDSRADEAQRWHVNAIGEDPTSDDQPDGEKDNLQSGEAGDVNDAGNAPGVTQKLDKPTPGDL